jgi:hypothetical protein
MPLARKPQLLCMSHQRANFLPSRSEEPSIVPAIEPHFCVRENGPQGIKCSQFFPVVPLSRELRFENSSK